MTDPHLRSDLLRRLNVSPQRLSQLVAQVKRLYGPMTTEEGTYVLAHQRGLDLTKYLHRETVDRIRAMLPKDGGHIPQFPSARPKARTKATRPVRVAPSMEVWDAVLPPGVAEAASDMAEVYPKLFVFENSLRSVISRLMSATYGTGWWRHAPADVQNDVRRRKDEEDKKPWHGKRGSHDIYYSDFKDLKKIITKNWPVFEPLFPSQPWITQKLEELEPPRNIVAHNNPLSAKEKQRIDVYTDDWRKLLTDKRGLIP